VALLQHDLVELCDTIRLVVLRWDGSLQHEMYSMEECICGSCAAGTVLVADDEHTHLGSTN
jgi:hypothetical protein